MKDKILQVLREADDLFQDRRYVTGFLFRELPCEGNKAASR